MLMKVDIFIENGEKRRTKEGRKVRDFTALADI